MIRFSVAALMLSCSLSLVEVAIAMPGNVDACAFRTKESVVLQNGLVRLTLQAADGRVTAAQWSVREGRGYKTLAVTHPLSEIVARAANQERWAQALSPKVTRLAGGKRQASVRLEETVPDPDGVRWSARIEITLAAGESRFRVRHSLEADREAALLRFTGPRLAAGEGSFADKKDFALFPGLEFLQGGERSSSERDADPPVSVRVVPHPFRITVPVMAVCRGPYLVVLAWDALQKWDGEHMTPSAVFASPNWLEGQKNHLMGLFLPSVPEWVKENEREASLPYPIQPGKPIALEATVIMERDPSAAQFPSSLILRAIDHWYAAYGLPEPPPMARSYPDELALIRHGLLVSCWDETTQKSRHCVDWAPANAPGFAALLWLDARLEKDPALKQPLDERAALIARNTIAEQGPGGLTSGANCHIMRWEFPFYYGHLGPALERMEAEARAAIDSQQPDGSWLFTPTGKQRPLGKWGDTVVGICASPAHTILRYARITGDQAAAKAGLRALKFMERFRIPAGAQAWECPLYEPDILASAWALAAYLEGYRLTGDRRLLDIARYWAKTGLPFLYAYNRPDTPGMRYASIPVFGTTFYTHSWLGVPVQWNGLVYAYHLQKLAEVDDSFPWRKVAEGITNSATHQQVPEEGKLKGTYCDGWYEFCTDKRGAWINPEDILVNLFTLRGHNPDVSTAILGPSGKPIHISSGARVSAASVSRETLSATLTHFPGFASHTLVAPASAPTAVQVEGRPLAPADNLEEVPEGWQYRADRRWLIIKAAHANPEVRLRVTFRSTDALWPVTGACAQENHALGFRTRPVNRTVPVSMSRIMNMNGRSTLSSMGDVRLPFFITTAVAAAASVPASSTATNAL